MPALWKIELKGLKKVVTPAALASQLAAEAGMVCFKATRPSKQCHDPVHTAQGTKTRHLSRVTPAELKKSRFTGTLNYLVMPNLELRLAYALPVRASCGRKLNGHAHLAKVEGETSDILAGGELKLVKGNPVQLDNRTGTFKPEGDLATEQAQAHKNQAISAIAKAFGARSIVDLKYISYSHGGNSTAIRFKESKGQTTETVT